MERTKSSISMRGYLLKKDSHLYGRDGKNKTIPPTNIVYEKVNVNELVSSP